MSRKQKKKDAREQSTRQLMGIDDITDYGIATRMGELVFFAIKPTNISVLPDAGVGARIYALLNVVKGILVKSISRFARNTKDCLEAVRELKELGVNVRFEREGIDTANVSSELITAIYAAFAQKESESISGNMRWSCQRRMEAGTFLPSSMAYGYKLVGRKIEIDADSALVVCRIFQWYLNGVNRTAIAKKLNEEGISSGQRKKWHDASVRYILTNEKYTGDSLWQKTYTSDTLPTTRHKNKGEHEQYYAVGTHPPIIPREIFDQAQNLLQKRETDYRKRNCPGSHPLTGKIVCGCCGSTFRRKEYRGKIRWACMGHERSGKDCPITPITGKTIYEAFCRLYYKLKHQSLPILEQMLETLRTIRDRRLLWSEDIVSLNKKISELSSQNQTLAFLKQNGLVDPDIFISKSNELTRQLRQAKLDKEELMDAEGDTTAQRTRELIALLEDGPDFLDRPDAELMGELVEKIIIESNDTLRFRLHNGLELRESIERTVR